MNTTQNNSLRKVAILVASLDEREAERLLASLPPQQARSVRQEVAALTDINPDEQRTIVAEFRRVMAEPVDSNTGVELDASLQERIEQGNYSKPTAQPLGVSVALAAGETEFLVEMLRKESAQTIAVVISRLDVDRAAEVLNHFSAAEQSDILDRLGALDTTDEQTVHLIEAQVSQWLATQRRRQERMAAGREMVERIMSRTTSKASSTSTVISGRLPRPTNASVEYLRIASGEETKSTATAPIRYERRQDLPIAPRVHNPYAELSAEECQKQLEKLPQDVLLDALAQSDSQVVSLALVGVSERLLKRVLRTLSRDEARQFRQQLRDLGPTRISDILAAQQEILRIAQSK